MCCEGTNFTEEGIKRFTKQPNLRFSGGIDAVEWQPTLSESLEVLSIDKNELQGPVAALTCLQNIRELNLDENAFTGTIPREFFSGMPHMYTLELQNNQLSGPIPVGLLPSVAPFRRITVLNLHGNANLTMSPVPRPKLLDFAPKEKPMLPSENDTDSCVPAKYLHFTLFQCGI